MKGKIILITGPSGSGKTTLESFILSKRKDVRKIVTCTTRERRSNEKNGEDYHFLTREEFEKGIKENIFLEHADVYGNYYGSRKKDVEKLLDSGMNVVMVVDVQGARSIKEKMPNKAVVIFVLPSSIELLKERLVRRGKDSPEVIDKRLKTAKEEIKHQGDFDYVLKNDDLEEAEMRLLRLYEQIIKSG